MPDLTRPAACSAEIVRAEAPATLKVDTRSIVTQGGRSFKSLITQRVHLRSHWMLGVRCWMLDVFWLHGEEALSIVRTAF
jgi:hypothetical protein